MMVFWVVAALLTAAALLFVIPPLLHGKKNQPGVERNKLNISVYRDQLTELERDKANDILSAEQFEQGCQELERRLLEDVPGETDGQILSSGKSSSLTAVIVVVLLPVLAVGLYWQLGEKSVMEPKLDSVNAGANNQEMSDDEIVDQINSMVSGLAQRLQKNPEDSDGWAMLGRSYFALERYDDALIAFENAVKRNQNDPQLLVDYADAIAVVRGESLEGLPMQLISKALMLNPDNQKGLWLAGTAAVERADYKGALGYWLRLQKMFPAGSESALAMERNIAEAQGFLEKDFPADGVEGDQGTGKQVSGVVTIDPAFEGQYDNSDTLFVFARAKDGPRMPLAILRSKADKFPFEFVLDDSLSMNASMTLSQYPDVEVVARISKTGNAIPKSGELQGSIFTRTGTNDLKLVIDSVIP